MTIKILQQQGYSQRAIARKLGLSRNTVKKHIQREEDTLTYSARPTKPHKLDPYKDYLQKRIATATPVHLSAVVLMREIKAKVERMVQYVRNNFYAPLSTQLSASGLVLDVDTANIQLMPWLNSIANVREHNTIKEQPMARLRLERPYLQALPLGQPTAPPAAAIQERVQTLPDYPIDPLHHDLTCYDEICNQGVSQ